LTHEVKVEVYKSRIEIGLYESRQLLEANLDQAGQGPSITVDLENDHD
jgi:hypothetical protein